jgi:predicted porin
VSGSTGTTTWTAAASDLTANSSVKYTTMGGNYKFGDATVYYGATTAKGTGVSLDTTSSNIAVKYALSKTVDLMANVVKIDDKLAANATKDQSLTGLGADYKFSNRTNAYVRYETYKANKADATKDVNATAVGIRHQF